MPWHHAILTAPCAALLLLGCTQDASDQPSPPTPGERVAFVGIQADLGSLNQHFARSALDAIVSEPLSLFLFSSHFEGGRLVYSSGLAQRWSLSQDGRELELQLRPDSTWHDGQPVRAQDVAFTFGLLADPQVGSRLVGGASQIEPGGVSVIDEHSLRLRYTQPMRLDQVQSQLGGVVILPEHLLAGTPAEELRGHGFNRAPVLNGCWQLDAWEPGTQIGLTARPWGEGPGACAPRIDRVVFRIIPEYATRLLELREGRLDIVADVRVQDLATLPPEQAELTFHRRGPRSLVYVGWNQQASAGDEPHPLLGDPRVRRALAQAVDIDAIMRDLFYDPATGETYAEPAVGAINPALAGMSGKGITPIGHDPASARTTLAAMGWRDSDGDGVLDRDGVAFRFELLTQASAASRAQAGVYVQADLAKIGVAVDITTVERATWMDRAQRGEFDALLGGWSASLYVDPTPIWHSGPDAQWNWIGYANPEVDALIERGMTAGTPEVAVSTWQALQATVYQDQPYLFLYWADEIVAVSRRLEGVSVGIEAPWYGLEGWHLAQDGGS